MKNNWISRIFRTFTAILPVSRKRSGECVRCGECCKLPNICPALRYDEEGYPRCAIYKIRPLNCRKYPRNSWEHITQENCGYSFGKIKIVNESISPSTKKE